MKFKTGECGFVLAEFAIALPLLILLLYALGMVTLSGLKIAREQVADYALETEAQYVIDRITSDARAAKNAQIDSVSKFDKIIFICHGNEKKGADPRIYDIFDQRIYKIDNRDDGLFCVYFKRNDDDTHNNPITGENSYGRTFVTQFKACKNDDKKILHVILEMESVATNHKVKFATSVFMPSYEK